MANHKKPMKGAKDMINGATIGKSERYKIDLAHVEGEGSFPCPKCGTMISPDDESEEIYKVIDTEVIDGELVGLVISCGTCRTIINVTGFQQIIEGLTSK